MVEVTEHETHGVPCAPGPLHLEVEHLVEASPVSHPGERVLPRSVGEALDEPVETLL